MRAFDLAAAEVDKPGRVLRAEPSAANGVAVHPHRDWLAVATGSRALPDVCGEPAAVSTNRIAVYAFERPIVCLWSLFTPAGPAPLLGGLRG